MNPPLATDVSPPPPLLAAMTGRPRRCRGLVLLLALAWTGLGAGDWFMRFHWFGWQRNIVVRPAAPAAVPVAAAARVVTNAPSRGGDLSRLVGIPRVAARYEEQRPGVTNHFDASGFQNPLPLAARPAVAVVGDSYAAAGPSDGDLLAVRLAAQLRQPVYNHAVAGRGSFWAIVRFFSARRPGDGGPRVLVWPVIEREIAGAYFEGGLYQVVTADGGAAAKPAEQVTRVDWRQLRPAALRKALPDTSAFSMVADRLWTRLRHAVFGRLNPAVIPSADDAPGGPMLFYAEALESHRWSDRRRDLDHVVHALSILRDRAREQGVEIVIALVPDKERIHAGALPAHARTGIRPSVLPEVERRLAGTGVQVVNLLPAFQAAAERGQLLYWRDDTHWNPEGIRLAAATIAPVVSRLLEEGK